MNGLYYISSSGSRFPAAFSNAFKSSDSEFSSDGREVAAVSPDGSVVMASCMAATISWRRSALAASSASSNACCSAAFFSSCSAYVAADT